MRVWTTLFLLFGLGFSSTAQPAEEFYKSKTVTILVGYGPGGGYDVYARLLSRHMGKHLPGQPSVVVQNMPGAASLRSANHLYNVALKDGTVIGTFARNMALLGVMKDNPNVQFDPAKFIWLGSASSMQSDAVMLFVRKDAGFASIDDLRNKEILVGGSGEGGGSNDLSAILKDVLGFKFRIVSGYPDGNALSLAVDRKEVDARFNGLASTSSTKPDWLQSNSSIKVMLQFGRATRHPDFPDAPTVRELATTEWAQSVIRLMETPYMLARPFVAPPGVPTDRAKALQDAFMKTNADPAYLDEGQKLKLDMSPVGPEQASALIAALSTAPSDLLEYLKNLQ
jgi:tripartite-type tricarboxylate transporter receptor subunit TctC